MRDDKHVRGFFLEKSYENGHMLTGNKIGETPYKFRATAFPKQVVFGNVSKKKTKI